MKLGRIEPLKLEGFKLAEKNGRKWLVAPLDKTRMFYSEDTGRLYLDLVMIETPNSNFSDYCVSESITKEEKEQGLKLEICGNFKNFKKNEPQAPQAAPAQPDDDGDLPF